MKKKFTIEILFDNGIIESFLTEEGTEEDKERLEDYLSEIIKDGSKGTVTLVDSNGNLANINVLKITRFTVL